MFGIARFVLSVVAVLGTVGCQSSRESAPTSNVCEKRKSAPEIPNGMLHRPRVEASQSPTGVENSEEPAVSSPFDSNHIPKEGEAKSFEKLTVDEIRLNDGTAQINGATDLPDGAKITAVLDIPGRPKEAVDLSVEGFGTVSGGRYSVEIVPLKIPAYAIGKQVVEVYFLPFRQPQSVIAMVGEDGERLTGELTNDEWASSRLLVRRNVSLKFPRPQYPGVVVSEYRKGSAERALAEFLSAWSDRDWKRMVQYTQLTWRDGNETPETDCEAQFSNKYLLGAEILKDGSGNAVVKDLEAKVFYYARGFRALELSTKIMPVRVIREDGAYSPSVTGQWGVNPLSAMRVRDI